MSEGMNEINNYFTKSRTKVITERKVRVETDTRCEFKKISLSVIGFII
jgi:hypothetical protein